MGVSIKDEPQDLVKFLLHHWCLGVEKFLIYDESTSTSVRQVAMQANTIIPTRYEKAPPKSQREKQLDAIRRAEEEGAQWVGGLDVDEYLHVPGGDLPALLHSLRALPVGVASFKWEMMDAGQSYDVLSYGQRGKGNVHVKSFAHAGRVDAWALNNPHTKWLKEGYVQLLVGPNEVMPNGPWATENGDFSGTPIEIQATHPSCIHFHAKTTLAAAVRKLYRGTGDIEHPSDTTPMNQMLNGLLPPTFRNPEQHWAQRVPFDPAFAALVDAVGMATRSLREERDYNRIYGVGTKMIDACAGASGFTRPASCFPLTSTAAVRCCTTDGSSCASEVPGCTNAATYDEAEAICAAFGRRLCTPDEASRCCGSGCVHDERMVWTSESCAAN